jgi:hypothetical protein
MWEKQPGPSECVGTMSVCKAEVGLNVFVWRSACVRELVWRLCVMTLIHIPFPGKKRGGKEEK